MCHPVRFAVAAVALLAGCALTSCRTHDDSPPWDGAPLAQALREDLYRHEGPALALVDLEILAWQVLANEATGTRVEVALVWALGRREGSRRWIVAQMFRYPESPEGWRRSVWFRELRAPLTHLRPGEHEDGTWDAWILRDRAPTSREICDFAAVDFLAGAPGWRRVAGAVRHRAWEDFVGEAPACDIKE
ncbi:MAG TPA: hypothetical protein VM364_22420 [Vicinamibacterales bacterium]|nr:hypothetical protein [Vicinamibacterales bacterium]